MADGSIEEIIDLALLLFEPDSQTVRVEIESLLPLFIASRCLKRKSILLQPLNNTQLVILFLLMQYTDHLIKGEDAIFEQLWVEKLQSSVLPAVAPSKKMQNDDLSSAYSVILRYFNVRILLLY